MGIKIENYCYDGTKAFNIKKTPTDSNGLEDKKKELVEKTQENTLKIAELQNALFAEHKEAVLICFQALDAGGKDSTISHVLLNINPLGIDVYNYRGPSADEASHDFLWRYHKNLPMKGKIAVFNRSYYEEVLVVKVHEYFKDYSLPKRIKKSSYIEEKYKDIKSFEKYMYGNSIRVIKFFLNLSKDEQKKRFLDRINRPEKNWKFSENDIKERQFFEKYQEAFEAAINNTSTKECPWYVIPADQKWYARYLVSEIILSVMKDINPAYPEVSEQQKKNLANCKKMLEEEGK
ncbi:MAG: polyphosphate kinase 2 family protein [Treponema sp.]|nr:polyphosphate kinase 2 family protein [Treponema sp.]